MKWFDSFKKSPKKGSMIWVWNTISQKQEMFIVNPDIDWNPFEVPKFPIWSYVFEEDLNN